MPGATNKKATVAEGLALVLETACEDFEIMQRLIAGHITLSGAPLGADARAAPRIQMALAKSFIFNVVRARRICEHGAGVVRIDREERRKFLSDTAAALRVRDVNEHAFDVAISKRGKTSTPEIHTHADESAVLDETSMITLGPQKILMGPVNLFDIYLPTDRMRGIAGFMSLPGRFPSFSPAPTPAKIEPGLR
ncbi:hypothetical protein [Rhodoblastus sp.]|uniref:hypothetical protein n=1 Tax=Rhodoblastus sp. TaxID=1962975 RepID=UPI002604D339|nr:hypothetical protein [Rhodoblastus sp.]